MRRDVWAYALLVPLAYLAGRNATGAWFYVGLPLLLLVLFTVADLVDDPHVPDLWELRDETVRHLAVVGPFHALLIALHLCGWAG